MQSFKRSNGNMKEKTISSDFDVIDFALSCIELSHKQTKKESEG